MKPEPKKGVMLEILNWDTECEIDFATGRGFEITEPAFKGKDQKCMHGIQSPIFCSDWSDEDAFSERYSCQCGEMRGKIFEGETCPVCKTKIKFKDVDLSITGWIRLYHNKIIQPIFYNKLVSVIGKKQFEEIITFDKKITRNGQLEPKEGSTPFKGIGLIDFYERFDEIIAYYKKKKKQKMELIEEIEENKDKVFTSSIPVYSSVLRPTSFKGKKIALCFLIAGNSLELITTKLY